jgi:sulfide:quinone oxidoreductase
MTHQDSGVERRKVLIVGGGIAGIEALMALADLGDRRLDIELVAEKPGFVLRPQIIGEPWGGPPLHIALDRLCHDFGARFTPGSVVGVNTDARHVVTAGGDTIEYERLLMAPGARSSLAYTGTRTIGFGALPRALATGGSGSFAIVVPASARWTLPAYELALLITANGRSARVVTDEHVPLQLFGPSTYSATREMLERHGVTADNRAGRPLLGPIEDLAGTVVSLPLLNGPAIAGLPVDDHGFIRVGPDMRVPDAVDVFAAGDATVGPIKQGGLAAQQADTAASEIVRSCGSETPRTDYAPVLRGKLTAGDGDELYLRRVLDGLDSGTARQDPLWQPSGVVCAWRLARWLSFRRTVVDNTTLGHVAQPGLVA